MLCLPGGMILSDFDRRATLEIECRFTIVTQPAGEVVGSKLLIKSQESQGYSALKHREKIVTHILFNNIMPLRNSPRNKINKIQLREREQEYFKLSFET